MFFTVVYGRDMFNVHYGETGDAVLDHDDAAQEDLLKKRHLTVIFNTFIFLQFFNFLNCRVVGSREFNVFKGLFAAPSNLVLPIIMAVIFII